jgi:hypothetical protein
VTRHFEALQCLHLEDQEGTTIFQNAGYYLPDGTTLTSHKNGIFSYAAVRTSNFVSLDVSVLLMRIAFTCNRTYYLGDWLTVHRSITLVDLQLDVKILIYLHIIHLLKSSTCFKHYSAHLQEVYFVIIYMQPLVLSLSAGDCLVHRLRKNSFLTGAQDSHLQRVTIPEAAYIQLRSRPPEDEQDNVRNM